MDRGNLTKKEEELMQTLLAKKGITKYHIFDPTEEGKNLPGSRYPCEIESMSGYVVTPTKVYDFWLDWINDHYTLGEEDGIWRERDIEELSLSKEQMKHIQQQLRQVEE